MFAAWCLKTEQWKLNWILAKIIGTSFQIMLAIKMKRNWKNHKNSINIFIFFSACIHCWNVLPCWSKKPHPFSVFTPEEISKAFSYFCIQLKYSNFPMEQKKAFESSPKQIHNAIRYFDVTQQSSPLILLPTSIISNDLSSRSLYQWSPINNYGPSFICHLLEICPSHLSSRNTFVSMT